MWNDNKKGKYPDHGNISSNMNNRYSTSKTTTKEHGDVPEELPMQDLTSKTHSTSTAKATANPKAASTAPSLLERHSAVTTSSSTSQRTKNTYRPAGRMPENDTSSKPLFMSSRALSSDAKPNKSVVSVHEFPGAVSVPGPIGTTTTTHTTPIAGSTRRSPSRSVNHHANTRPRTTITSNTNNNHNDDKDTSDYDNREEHKMEEEGYSSSNPRRDVENRSPFGTLIEATVVETETNKVSDNDHDDVMQEKNTKKTAWSNKSTIYALLMGGITLMIVIGIVIVVVIVLLSRRTSPSTSLAPSPPPSSIIASSASPSSLPTDNPFKIACDFLQEQDVNLCQTLRVISTSFVVNSNLPSTTLFTIPSELGLLTNIVEISLSNITLVGSIPSSIGNLVNLEHLDLSFNVLNGSIPNSIGDLTKLTFLDLAGNRLAGSIPHSIGNLTQVIDLRLYDNILKGSIPVSIGELTQLTAFYCRDNSLSGNIPDTMAGITQLEVLWLNSNLLQGKIPSIMLESLSQLTDLSLNDNKLTGSIPDTIRNVTELMVLWFNNNDLNGTIPPFIGELSRLTDLRLFSNNLVGNIPNSIGNLTQIKLLSLGNNALTGSIPSSMGSLTQLTELHLNENRLSGSMPSSLCGSSPILDIDCSEITCTCCVTNYPNYVGCTRRSF